MVMAAIAKHVGQRHARDVPTDYPVHLETLRQDLPYAQRAVVIHQSEDWPTGRFCWNCHARWPCRLHRWGLAVLLAAEWTPTQLHRLVEHAKAGEVPWR